MSGKLEVEVAQERSGVGRVDHVSEKEEMPRGCGSRKDGWLSEEEELEAKEEAANEKIKEVQKAMERVAEESRKEQEESAKRIKEAKKIIKAAEERKKAMDTSGTGEANGGEGGAFDPRWVKGSSKRGTPVGWSPRAALG